MKHGTMGLQCVLSRPGVGHLTRHCHPARCLRHHVKTVQAHREDFMSGRPAANLSSGIAAATDLVVLVQPWLMTVAGWHVSTIWCSPRRYLGAPVVDLGRLPQANPTAFRAH